RKAIRVLAAKLGHRVIRYACEIEADVGRRDILDCRIRQGDDLAIIAELVHLLEARIKIEQLGHAAQAFPDVFELWCDLRHLTEKSVRIDVAIDVDNGHDFPLVSFPSTKCRCSGRTCQPSRSTISPHSPLGAHNIAMMATAPIMSK